MWRAGEGLTLGHYLTEGQSILATSGRSVSALLAPGLVAEKPVDCLPAKVRLTLLHWGGSGIKQRSFVGARFLRFQVRPVRPSRYAAPSANDIEFKRPTHAGLGMWF